MKKVLTVAALLSALTLAGMQTASAHGGRYYNNNYGYGNSGPYDTEYRTPTDKDRVAIEKFRAETSSIRKEIVMKRSELQALYANDNPDAKKVAELTGELYDLETGLRKNAAATELDTPFAYRHGPGMMQGYGGGRGWHMMGW